MSKVAGPDVWIVWVNLAGASFACAVNVIAIRRRWLDWQALWWMTAACAFVYAVGYAAMVFQWYDVVTVSRALRGISPLVWLAAPWSLPALFARRLSAKIKATTVAIESIAESRLEVAA